MRGLTEGDSSEHRGARTRHLSVRGFVVAYLAFVELGNPSLVEIFEDNGCAVGPAEQGCGEIAVCTKLALLA